MSVCYTKPFKRKVLTSSFCLAEIWMFQSVPDMKWEWHNYDVPVPAKTVPTSPRWKCGTVCTCLCIHDECPPSIPLHPEIGLQLPGGHLQAKSTNQRNSLAKLSLSSLKELSQTLSILFLISVSLSVFLSLLTFSLSLPLSISLSSLLSLFHSLPADENCFIHHFCKLALLDYSV